MSGRLEGKVIVITGATSGIGQVAAEALAGMGARIVQIARDRERAEAALARLQDLAPGVRHVIHYADLSRLAEMRRVGRDIAIAEPRIDVLINNAGAMFGFRQLTADGLERTFALESSGLLRPDGPTSRAPRRDVAGSRDQHELRRASRRDAGTGRPAVGARLSNRGIGNGFGSAAPAIASTGDRSCATSSSRASWRDAWMALASPPTVSIPGSWPPASAIRVVDWSPLAFGSQRGLR